MLGQLRLVDLLQQFLRVTFGGVALSEFRPDRLELLPQIKLAMMLLDLDLGLLLDVFEHAGAGHFLFPFHRNELEALSDVEALEDLVLFGDPQVARCRREVGEPARLVELAPQQAGDFRGELLVEFDERFGGGTRRASSVHARVHRPRRAQ